MQCQKSKIWFSAILYFIFPRQSNLLELQPWGLSPCIYYSPKSDVQSIHSAGKLLIKCGFSNQHSITVCQEHEENQFSGSLTMRTPFFFPQHPASFTESYSAAEIRETGDLNSFLSAEVAGPQTAGKSEFSRGASLSSPGVLLPCRHLPVTGYWDGSAFCFGTECLGLVGFVFLQQSPPSPAFLPLLKFSPDIPPPLNPHSSLQVLGPITRVQAL